MVVDENVVGIKPESTDISLIINDSGASTI